MPRKVRGPGGHTPPCLGSKAVGETFPNPALTPPSSLSTSIPVSAVFLKVLRGPAGPSPESTLPHVQCPVIAIWGENDPWTPINQGLHPGRGFSDANPYPNPDLRVPRSYGPRRTHH